MTRNVIFLILRVSAASCELEARWDQRPPALVECDGTWFDVSETVTH